MRGGSRKLIFGQLIGQVALLLAIPALTRILPVGEMGLYQIAFSIAAIIQPLATLRREMLIPVSSVENSRRLRVSGLTFASAFSLILLIAGGATQLWWDYAIGVVLCCTGLVLASFSLTFIENAYLIRHGAQGKLAARNLLGGIVGAGFQVCFALVLPVAVVVALGLLIGRLIATLATLARASTPDAELGGGERLTQRSISAILSAMIATASSQAVVIVTAGTLGAHASAQVAIGQRLAGAPASLVGQALTQIALGNAAPYIRQRRPGLTARLKRQTLVTAGLAALAAVALIVLAPMLAAPVLGDAYIEAGVLTAIFAIPLTLTLVALPATSLMIPLGRERQLFLIQLSRLVAIVCTIVVSSTVSGDVIVVSTATSIMWTLAYVPLLVASFRATRQHDIAAQGSDVA